MSPENKRIVRDRLNDFPDFRFVLEGNRAAKEIRKHKSDPITSTAYVFPNVHRRKWTNLSVITHGRESFSRLSPDPTYKRVEIRP